MLSLTKSLSTLYLERFQLNYNTLWINFEPELKKKQQSLYSLDTLRQASFNTQVQRI